MTPGLLESVAAMRGALLSSGDYAAPFNAVVDAGRSATAEARDEAIRALLAELGDADPWVIAELAVASGALVEQGGSPTESVGVLLDALAASATALLDAGSELEAADLDHGKATEGMSPLARSTVRAFRRLVVGTMARLARSVEARNRAREHPRLGAAIRAVADQVHAWHLTYIVEILDLLDDAPMLLVDTGADTVTRLRVTGIRNCFHLITLLEGHDPFTLTDSVGTTQGYYTWAYLGITSDLARDIVQTMIPGDLRAVDLPAFEGTRVVVRTPTGVQRFWDLSFVSPIHDALRSTITTEETLSPDDARTLRERMAAAAAAKT